MFDKLIESNSEEAEFKPRRKFFMVSSVVVGILFVTAVVASLYAQNIDLGTDSFEMAELLAPVAQDAPEPEPPRQQPQQRNDQQQSELPSRQDLIARIDQPTKVPTEISTTPFKGLTIPEGRFKLDRYAPEGNGSGSVVGNSGIVGSSSAESEIVDSDVTRIPPPAVAKVEPKTPVIKTKGVINGEAIDLPKPPYPAAALAVNVSGQVDVQVLIDETGKVVSAKAVAGPLLLKREAERAAWRARFKPTFLGGDPVKVTGVIVYRFSR